MVQQGPSPGPNPKRRSAFIGLYDLPLHRDWMAWMTLAWALLAALAIGTTKDSSSSLPRWADTLLATAVFALLFGVLPAWVRLGIRHLLVRRRGSQRNARAGAPLPGYGPAHGAAPYQTSAQPVFGPAWPMPGSPASTSSGPAYNPERPATVSNTQVTPDVRPQAQEPAQSDSTPPSAPQKLKPVTESSPTDKAADQPSNSPTVPRAQPEKIGLIDYVKHERVPTRTRVARSNTTRLSAESARPTPLSSLQPTGLAQSDLLMAARMSLQYPIARAARAIQLAAEPKDEYEEILAAGEAVAITLGAMIAATIGPVAAEQTPFVNFKAALTSRGLSQGHWNGLVGAADAAIAKRDEPLAGLKAALRRGPRGSGLVADLGTLVEERNRWAHGGGPRTSVEAGLRLTELVGPIERIFDRCAFLAESPWILTRSSSYKRTTANFEVSASEAMGDHPEFERRLFASQLPLADETFNILGPSGPVDLTPFVVMRYCETCREPELCYADRLDKRDGVALKSFARGHNLFDHSLDDEVRGLWDSDRASDTGSA